MIECAGRRFAVHRATQADLPALVSLLIDDPIGAAREMTDLAPYETAFRQIDTDPRHFLAAVRAEDGELVGTMQLTLVPGLSRAGSLRLQIEAVRVARSVRGLGLGSALFAWAHDFGQAHGAQLAQLTSDQRRPEAHRFYHRMGYEATHQGFKRPL